ncbi:UvrD-helicase-domain-containing protein [Setomelanomma holmii]|uniref:DNA 3'-5' helicase n=1 Tax=Setomelanomma holmii TaxID=210430 RepID=A0A9P4H4S9_9PLEO|nr:UvrD-helicase-domain-containing protein [Setomelanomma holmii]
MEALLEGLNDAQRSAVTSPASVVQVLAPPGSGKTKTLTARVAYHVVHERLQPWNIIVCTFTIKAAREMKERIKGFVGDKLEAKLILGTFHSVARRFLSRYGQEIGIDKNFGIADTNDSKAILKRIVTRYQYTVEPGHARSRISTLKAKGVSADSFKATTKNVNDNEFAMVYSSYEEHLKASNLLDYDDLLVRCVELLKKSPSCVSTIQAVLIDEYQDTNNIQYELMKLMAQSTRRITIVGDPDQSIYSFRSAEIKNLFRMRDEFPESIVINLENNYRSSGCILNSALAVIEQDESRPQKALIATHGTGEPPTLRHLVSAQVEAKWIVEEIHRVKTLAAGLLSYNDYAILLRSSNLSLQIERALGQAGMPYRMVAGTKFFERAEIRIILDYLRVVSQTEHNDAVARVINLPSRKVGDTTVKALLEEAETRKITLWKLVLDIAQGRTRPQSKVSSQAQKGMEQFVNVILTAREKLISTEGDHCNLFDLIWHILKRIAFETYLKQTHKDNWQDRWANVEELVSQATQMATAMASGEEITDDALPVVEGIEQRQDTAADILSKFLANVTLSSVADQDGGNAEQITISTIHAAKGLEWPIVFMPAVYDGSIPHSRAEDHDEERRLLYVGMTHLARILRKPCPTTDQINVARAALERLEDDQYPATREEIDDPMWGASWDDRFNGSGPSSNGPQQTYKRRKLEEPNTVTHGPVAFTMNRTSGFSVASTTMHGVKPGFTTARDLGDLQAMQQEAERIRMLAAAPTAEAGQAAYNDDRKAAMKPAQAKKVKPRAVGQGAITNFFAKISTSTPTEQAEMPTSAAIPSLQRSQSSTLSTTPLHDISNVPQPSRSFQPLSLPNYRLNNRPMPSKPKRSDTAPELESTRYVLLSSSTVRPDQDDLPEEPHSPVRQSSSITTSSGFRTASTFHTTSMSQVQAQRKTLGTRRTMQGWSVKHSSMPKPRQT